MKFQFRFRLLPVLIFCTALTVSVKLGSLWHGLDGLIFSSAAIAEEKAGKAPTPGTGITKTARSDPDGTAKKRAKKTADAAREAKIKARRFDPRLVTDSELDILQKLADRRTELDRRSRQLDTREKLLQATENRIESKIVDLKQIQDTIAKLLKKHDKEKEAKLRSVVKIYEKMKPKDAARIFEELELPILLDVIERMREAKTASIIAKMTPGKAKNVTAALTHRRALPKLDQTNIN
jgi:flagellar motility protein MotE (MotC chaperone)